jgi:hypothetical protein
LELGGADGIAAFGTCEVLKDGLCLRVDIILVELRVIVREDSSETPELLNWGLVFRLVSSHKLEGVCYKHGLHILI